MADKRPSPVKEQDSPPKSAPAHSPDREEREEREEEAAAPLPMQGNQGKFLEGTTEEDEVV